MPRLAEIFKESGYLDLFGKGIGEFLKRNKKNDDQDQFNQIMQEAMGSLRKTYSTPEENVSPIIPAPKTDLGKNLMPKNLDTDVKKTLPGGDQDPEAFNKLFGGMNAPKQLSEVKRGSRTSDQQRMQQQQVMADFMEKAMKMGDLDPEKMRQGLELLKMQSSANTPEKVTSEYKQFDDTKSTYRINSLGDIELVREGEEKENIKSLGSYTGNDGYNYIRLIGKDGIIKDVKSENKVKPPKGTVINFKPPKSEKWSDFGSYINSIDYKEDPTTGKIIPNTPEERKVARDLAKNQAIGNMLPRAVNWYNTEIKTKWGVENISMSDFESEIQESYEAGELSADEAQDLLDMNQFRPYLFDLLRDSARNMEGEE